jgi:hypothetical protein
MTDKSSEIKSTGQMVDTSKDKEVLYCAICCFVIAMFFGVISIVSGIVHIMHDPNQDSIPVDANVLTSRCTPYPSRRRYRRYGPLKYTYKCDITVSYNIDGKQYTSSPFKTDSDNEYNVGEAVKVRVSKTNYIDARLDNIPSNSGYVFLILGIVLMLLCSANLGLVRRYPKWGEWFVFITGGLLLSRLIGY